LAVVLSVINRLTAEVAMQAVAEGLVLGAYEFHGEKTEAADKKPVRTTTVFYQGRTSAACSKALRTGQVVAESQCFARDLGNQPGNIATPRFLAAQARRLAKEGPLRCKVLSKAELVKKKYGGVLAVAAGSAEPPVFIELEYRPARAKKSVCLVGKGLSFDSGGISLKPPAGMEEMKFDMCGGAAVLGAMRAVAALKPPVRVHGLIPSSENMPGSRAIKPGDVFKTYGGISVEVINTDAEGRLILADALGRAQELKADYTIDLATLTGACVVALGHRATGLFCAHDDLSQHLTDAGEQAGERLWPLPLWGEFRDELKSMVADIKNSGSRWGGAVTAAAFLQKFAGDLNWAHLDIAGTAWDTPKTEYYAKGATGVGVRTLVQFIQSLA
jgi:leucyl aminopeptidase